MTERRVDCVSKRRAAIRCLLPLFFSGLLFEILVDFPSRWLLPQLSHEKLCKTNAILRNHSFPLYTNETISVDGRQSESYTGLAIVGAFNHQRDVFKHKDPINASFEYIQSWYESIQQFPSMQGVVLHNMFTPEQTKEWTTNQIHFISVGKRTQGFQQSKQRPINDMRFYILWEFLKQLYEQPESFPPDPNVPEYILFSDSYDVRFLRNPFQYMQQMDQLVGRPQIYVGEEYQDRKAKWDEWMNKSSTICFHMPILPSSRMVNCGLLGGHRSVLMTMLELFVSQLNQATPHKVCDQISLYRVLSTHYQDKFISGYPFNALFNQWEKSNQTLAYIAHK